MRKKETMFVGNVLQFQTSDPPPRAVLLSGNLLRLFLPADRQHG